VVQEHLPVLQRSEQVGRLRGLHLCELGVGLGQEGRVLQRLPVEVGDREQPAQVERARHPEDLLLGDVEFADEQREHLLVDVVLDLQPHRGPADLAAQELLLEGEEQVLRVVLLHLDVLVPRHPERAVAGDLHAGEQLVEVAGDDVLQRHEPAFAERDEPGEDRGHLDAGELPRAGDGVLQQHGQVDAEPGDVGEGVRRVDGQWGEHREDPVLEQLGHLLALVRVQFLPAQDLDAVLRERGAHIVGEDAGGLRHQFAGAGEDRVVQFPGHQAGVARHGEARGHASLQPGHAHHEELVEIGGEDREEPRPLQQRHALGVLGQVEHTVVEGEPGQLTVGEAVGRQLRRIVDKIFDRLFVLNRGHDCS